MNKFLWLTFFRLMAEADGISGGGAAVVDAPAADPAPVDPTPAPIDPVVIDTPADPSDPYAALEAAMKAELGDDPAPVDPAVEAQPAPEFQQLMGISDFVKSPEHAQAAIRAADEVWKVASGQAPVSGMLEGLRADNEQNFAKIVGDLIPYIEQITGKSFGAAPETPPDPRDARLAAIESKFQQEEQQRQQAAFTEQLTKAREVATSFLTGKAKGTFAEGQEAYLLNQIGAKASIPVDQMVQMLLTGKTDKLEAAYKEVLKDETARLKAYNANLIKKHRSLANGVPASKGSAGPGQGSRTDLKMAALPGESTAQHATRLWKTGLI